MKRSTCLSILLVAASAHAVTGIDFESPYTISGTSSGGDGSAVNAHPFTGQQGWSTSSGNAGGIITNSVSSGAYVGSQVLAGGNVNGSAYLGVNNTFTWASATISFDLLNRVNEKMGIGGWTDLNSDGQYQQGEASAYGGINTSGIFTIRGAAIGSDFLASVGATIGNWYHITLTYNDLASSITMDAFNLTTSTVVDLNGVTVGTSFTHTFAGGAGDVYRPVSGFSGVFARTTGLNQLDNIASVVPEPSTLALAAVGGLGLFLRRRKV